MGTIKTMFSTAILAAITISAAQAELVGDLRIGSSVYTSDTAFDPGFSTDPSDPSSPLLTRAVLTAPIQINSAFSGGSQESGGSPADSGTDINLRTFSSVTRVRNLSRFTPSEDGTGVARVGMVQWSIDLNPLDGYLATNSLSLTSLDLDLNTVHSDLTKDVDLYLSYTNPAESILLASIDSTTASAGSSNWTNFYSPAVGATVGDIVGGTHKVLVAGEAGNLALNESLLSLYNSGVREFNLQLAGADFWSGRNIDIAAGSGISIETETVSVPEPASLGFGSVAVIALLLKRQRNHKRLVA